MDAPTYHWLHANLYPADFLGKSVLEVGSRDVNGSPRALVYALKPSSYHGIDIEAGDGVDEVLGVHECIRRFGPESFDAILSTEALEHIHDWRDAINQMKALLRPTGLIILTTRRPGFPLHGHPDDHWRFTEQNLATAFQDFWVKRTTSLLGQGVGIIAQKPLNWEAPFNLNHIHPQAAPKRPQGRLRRLLWLYQAYGFTDPVTPTKRPPVFQAPCCE